MDECLVRSFDKLGQYKIMSCIKRAIANSYQFAIALKCEVNKIS